MLTVVYPACAGIDLRKCLYRVSDIRLPRMRGDRPQLFNAFQRGCKFTPHARGSTDHYFTCEDCGEAYPACAGIDHTKRKEVTQVNRLPRMRGDRPRNHVWLLLAQQFTPHARGSTTP